MAAAPKLKGNARAGVGLDNVDIKAATKAGVMVVNAPTSNIISAAELAIGQSWLFLDTSGRKCFIEARTLEAEPVHRR